MKSNNVLLVKIFDSDKNYLGKGTLAKLTLSNIIVKGNNLPCIPSKSTIFLNIYNELKGISVYECTVGIAADMQLSATIVKQLQTIERRRTLKIRTNYTTTLRLIIRENKMIETKNPLQIKILNLSIGGMLFTSDTEFFIGDTIVFTFDYYKDTPIVIDAKIIRIDPPQDKMSYNCYGCKFNDVTRSDEKVIFKYLYERQLQLYKKK